MYEPDILDARIVELLMEDGRMPAAVIARRVGGETTERVVRYRIDRMVKEGVIQIWPVVNTLAFGLTTRADVVLEVESDAIKDVAEKVAKYDHVTYVACSIGETDVSLQLVARDTAEIYQFVTEVIGKLPGVRKTTTSIVPVVVKDVYQWRIPRRLVKPGDGQQTK
ncbi:MAG: Lrp/AsnC family transcriptional regulator [Chloroflexi bacterium]|nr:Lrp/AsnC family transcriptional regulator [Chloroflexota bacterium]